MAFVAALGACVTFIRCAKNAEKFYMKGWENAKQVYYDDIIKLRLEEENRIRTEKREEEKRLAKENEAGRMPLSPDLLMAYGVSTVGQLPGRVREAYNIKENQHILDLETLIRLEQEELNCGGS